MNAQTPFRSDDLFATSAIISSRHRWRRLRPFVALAALTAAALGGVWWWRAGRFEVRTDNAYIAGDIAPLGPRIEGDVAELLVADDQKVFAGQPLIRLEGQDWRARRAGRGRGRAGDARRPAGAAARHDRRRRGRGAAGRSRAGAGRSRGHPL